MTLYEIIRVKGSRVWTICEYQTIDEALRMMVQHNIGALPVVDDEKRLVGMISEREMIRGSFENGRGLVSMPVAWLMTRHLVTASPEDEIEEIMEVMTVNRVRHVPVLRDGRLQGIVSIGDVVKALLADSQHQIRYLKEFIYGPEV